MQSQNSVVVQCLQAMQGADNEARKQAEEQIKALRSEQAKILLAGFTEVIFSAEANLKPLACLLLKKFFLDDRKEEAELEQITLEEVSLIKQKLKDSLDVASEPMNLLRRKAEIICKLYKRAGSYGGLVEQVASLAG